MDPRGPGGHRWRKSSPPLGGHNTAARLRLQSGIVLITGTWTWSPSSSGTMVVCQLLLLGAKAYCPSLREGQQETGSFNRGQLKSCCTKDRRGGLTRAAEEWLQQDEGEASHLFWRTHDLTDSERWYGKLRAKPGSYNCRILGTETDRALPTLFGSLTIDLKDC